MLTRRLTDYQRKTLKTNLDKVILVLGSDFPMRSVNINRLKDRVLSEDEILNECERSYKREVRKVRGDKITPFGTSTYREVDIEMILFIAYVIIGGIIYLIKG